jgi:hypothetical protein
LGKKILISHSEENKEYAEALLRFLEKAKDGGSDIACSSVAGYDLRPGFENEAEIKKWLKSIKSVWVIISHESLSSDWVWFELGAAWLNEAYIVPIVLPGLTHQDLPKPISGLTAILADKEDVATKLISAAKTTCQLCGKDYNSELAQSSLDTLVKKLKMYSGARKPNSVSSEKQTNISFDDKDVEIKHKVYDNDLYALGTGFSLDRSATMRFSELFKLMAPYMMSPCLTSRLKQELSVILEHDNHDFGDPKITIEDQVIFAFLLDWKNLNLVKTDEIKTKNGIETHWKLTERGDEYLLRLSQLSQEPNEGEQRNANA